MESQVNGRLAAVFYRFNNNLYSLVHNVRAAEAIAEDREKLGI